MLHIFWKVKYLPNIVYKNNTTECRELCTKLFAEDQNLEQGCIKFPTI